MKNALAFIAIFLAIVVVGYLVTGIMIASRPAAVEAASPTPALVQISLPDSAVTVTVVYDYALGQVQRLVDHQTGIVCYIYMGRGISCGGVSNSFLIPEQ